MVSSDGAVVVLTARGDVLALHEYGTKKLGQRQHGVQQLQVGIALGAPGIGSLFSGFWGWQEG